MRAPRGIGGYGSNIFVEGHHITLVSYNAVTSADRVES
jgi:hypothetical protein